MPDSIMRTTGPSNIPGERRTLLRLRDLCDEVLASHRIAADRDLFSADDRDAARQLIPLLGR